VKRSRVSELKFLRALFFPRTVIAPSRTRALPSDPRTPPSLHTTARSFSGKTNFGTEISRQKERERLRTSSGVRESSSLSSPPSVATTSRREVTRRYATPFFRDISRQTVYSVEIYLFAGTRHLHRPIFALSLSLFSHPAVTADAVCFGETRGLEIKMGEGPGANARRRDGITPSRGTRGVSLGAIQCTTLRRIPAFQIVPFSFIHI